MLLLLFFVVVFLQQHQLLANIAKNYYSYWEKIFNKSGYLSIKSQGPGIHFHQDNHDHKDYHILYTVNKSLTQQKYKTFASDKIDEIFLLAKDSVYIMQT